MARAAEVAPPPVFDRDLDVRGLSCPWPAMRARNALVAQTATRREFVFYLRKKGR